MDFTGERMVPEAADAYTFWEHIYRYRFAIKYVPGRRVLDVACGEGYGGAALQAAGAASVIGVDVSAEACAHAKERYGLDARVGDAQNIPLENASVDVIISFETIEHLERPELLIAECARVLVPGGCVVISTPNREVYDEDVDNPYHLHELDEAEFRALLKARFRNVELYSQRFRRAPLYSIQSLTSDSSIWRSRRGFRRVHRWLQEHFCPEVAKLELLEHARQNPVGSILSTPRGQSHFANPFSIRPLTSQSSPRPLYLIAVATL